jgi:hypothetical protein
MITENPYQRGQIYTIRSHQTDLVYVGSTISPLHKRFHEHKTKRNSCSSKDIIIFSDAYIELLEEFPCNSKKELNKQEGRWIRQMDCVNKKIAGRTRQEYQADNKQKIAEHYAQYRAENKQKIAEYRAENKQKIAEQRAEYQAENKQKIAEYNAEYSAKNKHKIAEKNAKNYLKKKLLKASAGPIPDI